MMETTAMLPESLTNLANDFHANGFTVVRGLFSADEIAEIRDTFMEQAKDGPVEGLSDGHHAHLDSSDPLKMYPRMMHPHKHSDKIVGPVSMKYMLDSRLQELLAVFMKAEPVAAQSMFYFKPAGARGQDLHQDNFYLRVAPDTCYAAWVAVDDADEENGTMMVVPGSQGMEIACPQKSDAKISFTDAHVPVPEGLQAVPLLLKAGDVLFFNGSVIHGSYPNQSKDRFRRSFICHYFPADSVEISRYYAPITFTGECLSFAPATGGGACGNAFEPAGPH